MPGSAGDLLWYKEAIISELHVRAFRDSNGDGIGDFPRLTQKLDYLQDLGITCIWLLPFLPFSPERRHDISDYLGHGNGVRTPMQWNGDRNASFPMRHRPGCIALSSWIQYGDMKPST